MSDAAAPDPFGTGLPLDTQLSSPRPGTVLLAVDGEIDTLTAARLQAGLDEAVDVAQADGSAVSRSWPPAGWPCSSAGPGAWPSSAAGCAWWPPPAPSRGRCR